VSELQGNRIWSFCPLLFANLPEFSSSVSREFVESSSFLYGSGADRTRLL